MSECFVNAADFKIHWDHETSVSQSGLPEIWTGTDRRVGPKDRRQPGHDRRWDAQRGRRYRLRGRRLGDMR